MKTPNIPESIITPGLINQEMAQNLANSFDGLKKSQNYDMPPTQYVDAYEAMDVVMQGVTDYLSELSPAYANNKSMDFASNAVESSEIATRGETGYNESPRLTLIANGVSTTTSTGAPVIYGGFYANYGKDGFGISINPQAAENFSTFVSDKLKGLTTESIGTEAGFVLIATHELAHAVHDMNVVDSMLVAHPEWALSDSLDHANAIELERFANGVEAVLLARYIAKTYGGDVAKIEATLRFSMLGKVSGLAMLDVPNISSDDEQGFSEAEDNPGYGFALTEDELKRRLDTMAVTGMDFSLNDWKGMDKTEGSDWQKASSQAQLVLGLETLRESRLPLEEKRAKRKQLIANAALVLLPSALVALGVSIVPISDKVLDRNQHTPTQQEQRPPTQEKQRNGTITFKMDQNKGIVIQPGGGGLIVNGRIYFVDKNGELSGGTLLNPDATTTTTSQSNTINP